MWVGLKCFSAFEQYPIVSLQQCSKLLIVLDDIAHGVEIPFELDWDYLLQLDNAVEDLNNF